MADSFKNIIITPSIGGTADPSMALFGANTTANSILYVRVNANANGTLVIDDAANAELLRISSIIDPATNVIFQVYDTFKIVANGIVTVANTLYINTINVEPYIKNVYAASNVVNTKANSINVSVLSRNTVNIIVQTTAPASPVTGDIWIDIS
jgi:hypothetical protein